MAFGVLAVGSRDSFWFQTWGPLKRPWDRWANLLSAHQVPLDLYMMEVKRGETSWSQFPTLKSMTTPVSDTNILTDGRILGHQKKVCKCTSYLQDLTLNLDSSRDPPFGYNWRFLHDHRQREMPQRHSRTSWWVRLSKPHRTFHSTSDFLPETFTGI